jgi:hypothetical protein
MDLKGQRPQEAQHQAALPGRFGDPPNLGFKLFPLGAILSAHSNRVV